MYFTKDEINDFNTIIDKEFLLTNGKGSFCSLSLLGSNTRRYHGLLVASLNPPVERHLVVSNIHEIVSTSTNEYYLSTFECDKNYVGKGYVHLSEFQNNILPNWIYKVKGATIKKHIYMVYGENTTVVKYTVDSGNQPLQLKLYPLLNFRDYHSDRREFKDFESTLYENVCEVKLSNYANIPSLKMISTEGRFKKKEDVFKNMFYRKERYRGLSAVENHYMPGNFEISVERNTRKEVYIIFTLEDQIDNVDGRLKRTYDFAISRGARLLEQASYGEFENTLVKAADAFIVHRKSTNGKTILAGYPWFTDWGRDTLIAFTGLTLVTKRFDDAKSILQTFAKYMKNGLIPNVFPDNGQYPGYNTVDAPLWFVDAVYKYLIYTDDIEFVKELYPRLIEIIKRYMRTINDNYNEEIPIYSDVDGLIFEGNDHTQLTWMDAKVGDYVVTPRNGKAVEINALWYNALKAVEYIEKKMGKRSTTKKVYELVKQSFEKEFWNENEQCLYDVVNDNSKDASVRINQIFAVSLSFPVITGEKAKAIVKKVEDELYTPYGMRTLSPNDDRYKGVYRGDIWSRDTAYHQGTVWPWPMGAFISAKYKTGLDNKGVTVSDIINNLKPHLREGCIGHISEIVDGDYPHGARGCFAQAWSIGEILRAVVEK